LLGTAGILVGAALSAFLNWNKVNRPRSTRVMKNAPQITSEWNYRPREVIRRFAVVQSAETETGDLLTPNVAKDKNDNVWFNDRWLEFAAHPFVNGDNVDATIEETTTNAPLAGHACAVSAYD
jgi:hypothetical protein